MTVEIISREQWGARHDAGAGPAPLPAREVWLHHSVTIAPDLVPPFDDEHAAMRLLEQIGEDRFGRGISYTFAVMPTGRVYEGHGVATLGAHTKDRNSIARAIVLVGNYDTHQPTAAQIESTAQLLAHGQREGWWTTAQLVGGHRQAPDASTACPGRYAMAVIPAINVRAAALWFMPRPSTLAYLRKVPMYLSRDPHAGTVFLITAEGVRHLKTAEEWRCFQWLLDDDRDVDVDAVKLGIGDTPNYNARFIDVIVSVLARPVLVSRPV